MKTICYIFALSILLCKAHAHPFTPNVLADVISAAQNIHLKAYEARETQFQDFKTALDQIEETHSNSLDDKLLLDALLSWGRHKCDIHREKGDYTLEQGTMYIAHQLGSEDARDLFLRIERSNDLSQLSQLKEMTDPDLHPLIDLIFPTHNY